MCECDLEPGTKLDLLCSNDADREAEIREVSTSNHSFLVYFISNGRIFAEHYYPTHEDAVGNAKDWVDRCEKP
jgi:hypothetical protein